ncbi:hypothetical protein MOQ_005851 [Trypanosoma cruzi marinkellei]|uniref:Amastin n=1 Tax=Trypanosoma cruzi marinkellei TaxID=85056 RepID=K2MTC8_TRYCR|nr:hypothetical protein MOQ_005851 [Trypanosoma cruzi marinkellei]
MCSICNVGHIPVFCSCLLPPPFFVVVASYWVGKGKGKVRVVRFPSLLFFFAVGWRNHSMGRANHALPDSRNGIAENSKSVTSQPEQTTVSPPPPPPAGDLDISPEIVTLAFALNSVFLAVSLGTPWFLTEQYAAGPNGENVKETFQLWKTTRWVGSVRTSMRSNAIACTPVRQRLLVLQILAVLAFFISFSTFLCAVVRRYFLQGNSGVRLALIYCVAICFIILTVESAIGINVYTFSFDACGEGSSYHSRTFEVSVGFAFTIAAWAITTFAGVVVYNKVPFPRDERIVDYGIQAFDMLAFIAFLFSTVACAIPLWFYKDSARRILTEVFLWKERYSILWVTNASSNSTAVRNLGCSSLFHCFLAAEFFGIVSVLLNGATFVIGFLLVKSLIGVTNYALALGYISTMVAFLQWILLTCIYYGDWCSGSVAYHRKKYVMAAGFALSVTAGVLMAVGTVALTLTESIRRRYFPSAGPCKKLRDIFLEMYQ